MIRSKLEINGRPIDKGHPTYIIAEIGSNHNGKLEIIIEKGNKWNI